MASTSQAPQKGHGYTDPAKPPKCYDCPECPIFRPRAHPLPPYGGNANAPRAVVLAWGAWYNRLSPCRVSPRLRGQARVSVSALARAVSFACEGSNTTIAGLSVCVNRCLHFVGLCGGLCGVGRHSGALARALLASWGLLGAIAGIVAGSWYNRCKRNRARFRPCPVRPLGVSRNRSS